MADMLTLKTTFDNAAEAYDTYRPHYPAALFDKLITDTHLGPQSRLLEIGPGTGQATLPLAKRGYDITAIELGEHLAAKARQVLGRYRCVNVITGAFEEIDLPDNYFDLVFSATAIHWIKPEYKFAKPHHVLKPGGYLAIIHTEHISGGESGAFHKASQPIYDTFATSNSPVDTSSDKPLPNIAGLKPPEIDTKLFAIESFTAFPITNIYTAEEWTGLVGTYSPTLAMPAAKRQQFLDALNDLINTKFHGTIERRFGMTLTICKRKN
jgi:ubiquinone/menaquinone biosynthesis C-methylase UbiE